MSEKHRNAMSPGAATATYDTGLRRSRAGDLVPVERLGVCMQVSSRPKEIDRLPSALDELYPLPARVPDELNALINAVVEATRRRSKS